MVRKFKVTTNNKHKPPEAPNLLNRELSASGPDKVYVMDISYLWPHESWVYLAAVVDLYSRKVVGLTTIFDTQTDL